MIDRSFVEKLEELTAPHIINEAEGKFSDKELIRISAPRVATTKISSLDSLISIIKDEYKDYSKLIVRVDDEALVSVMTNINAESREREYPYMVEAKIPVPIYTKFNNYHPVYNEVEEVIIALNSNFLDTPDRQYVLRVISNLVETTEVTTNDDGLTQRATVKTGVQTLEKETIRPIVSLKPYRTFSEVEQPESKFIFRIKKGGEVALIEADGGVWKNEARKNISSYLEEGLKDLIKENKVLVIR